MEILDITRLVVALAVCGLASYSDWKTREASDLHWVVLGGAGLVILLADLLASGADPIYYLAILAIGFIFFDLLWGGEEDEPKAVGRVRVLLYILSFFVLGLVIVLRPGDLLTWHLVGVVVMFGLFVLFYVLNIIKGGADAMALIALSVVFPTYPLIGGLPLIHIPTELATIVFPFSFLILLNTALLSISIPFGLLIYNLLRGDVKFPAMIAGYRMKVSKARTKFVWPMERAGTARLRYAMRDDDDTKEVLDDLEKEGREEVWVTPQIPLLIPMTVAILFSTLVGNIMLLFVR